VTRHDFKRVDLRAFLARDWSLPRRLQDQETAELARRMDWTELLRRGDELRAAARWLMPEWPNAQKDEEDLAAHRQQAQRLLEFEARRQARAASHRSGRLLAKAE
jgi:hypothetical protein